MTRRVSTGEGGAGGYVEKFFAALAGGALPGNFVSFIFHFLSVNPAFRGKRGKNRVVDGKWLEAEVTYLTRIYGFFS